MKASLLTIVAVLGFRFAQADERKFQHSDPPQRVNAATLARVVSAEAPERASPESNSASAGHTTPAPTIEHLIGELRSGEASRQISAADALAALGEKAAPAASDLVKLLDVPEFQRQFRMHVVRRTPSLAAMGALVKIGPAATTALASVVNENGAAGLRHNAAYVLMRMGVEKNFTLLTPLASDPDPRLRRMFIGGIQGIPTKEAINFCVAALRDPVAEVRLSAMAGFPSIFRDYDARKNLFPDHDTLFGIIRSVQPLLNDSLAEVRAAAATTLGKLPDAAVTTWGMLTKALKDPDPSVRAAAARSIGQLGGLYSGPDLLECLNDTNSKVVIAAAEALGALKDPLATRRLVQRLEKDATPADIEVCKAAALALGKIADRRAVPPLIDALQRPKMAAAAAEALGNIGDTAAVAPLLEFLRSNRHGDLRLLYAPITALGQLGDARAITPLVELFFTPNMGGQPTADFIKNALARIHHAGVVLAVADRLAASQPSWRIVDFRGNV